MSDARATLGERPEALYLPVALASASFVFLNFALPARVASLGGGGLGVGAVFAVFTAFLLVGRPLVGWGLDRFGRRLFLLASMATYVVAMALYALLDGLGGLLLARAVQGAAAALMWVSVRTFVVDHAPTAERGQALGRVTEYSVRGSMAGAGLGFAAVGLLGVAAGWQLSFALFAACALVAAALLATRLGRRDRRVSPGMDASTDSASTDSTRESLSATAVVFGTGPVDPLLIAVLLTSAAGAVAFPFVLLALTEHAQGNPPLLALWMLPVAFTLMFLPSRAGRLSDRFGPRLLVPLALLVACLGSLLLGFADSPALIVICFLFVVAGTTAVEPAFAARAGGSDAGTRGRRFGRFELATGLGGVLGPLLGGVLHDQVASGAPFWLGAAVLGGALLVSIRVLAEPPGGQA